MIKLADDVPLVQLVQAMWPLLRIFGPLAWLASAVASRIYWEVALYAPLIFRSARSERLDA